MVSEFELRGLHCITVPYLYVIVFCSIVDEYGVVGRYYVRVQAL